MTLPLVTVDAETGGRRLRAYWKRTKTGRRLVREYQRTFRVMWTQGVAGPLATAFAAGLPAFGDYYQGEYEFDTGAYVSNYESTDQEDNPLDYHVVVSYSSDVEWDLTGGTGKPDDQKPGGNPTQRPVIINFDARPREQPLEQDYSTNANGSPNPQPVVNAAGEFFDSPPVMDEKNNLVILIKKNSYSYDPDLATAAIGSTNSDTWFGRPPGTARLRRWRGDQQQEEGIVFYSWDIEVECQADGWDWQVLNQGSYALDANGNQVAPISPATGLPAAGKVLLKTNGMQLPKTAATSSTFGPGANVAVDVVSTTNFAEGDQVLVDALAGGSQEVSLVTVVNSATVLTLSELRFDHAAGCPIQGVPNYLTFKRPRTKFNRLNFLAPG